MLTTSVGVAMPAELVATVPAVVMAAMTVTTSARRIALRAPCILRRSAFSTLSS
jgi:hypothetical protein